MRHIIPHSHICGRTHAWTELLALRGGRGVNLESQDPWGACALVYLQLLLRSGARDRDQGCRARAYCFRSASASLRARFCSFLERMRLSDLRARNWHTQSAIRHVLRENRLVELQRCSLLLCICKWLSQLKGLGEQNREDCVSSSCNRLAQQPFSLTFSYLGTKR